MSRSDTRAILRVTKTSGFTGISILTGDDLRGRRFALHFHEMVTMFGDVSVSRAFIYREQPSAMKAIKSTLAAIAILATTAVATAQQPPAATLLETHRDWNAYKSDAYGGICFAASQPKDSEYSQPIASRGAAFFMVSTIPSQNIATEASVIIGYPFADASKVVVDVDGQKFTMFTDADSAWVEAVNEQPALIDAMRRGRTMKVQGESRRGTISTDTYSLSGVTAAIAAAAAACPG